MHTVVMVLLTVVVGLFGVTSAVLGFIAEAKRITPEKIYASGRDCVYPANSAHTLGMIAVIPLAVAQIIASVAGGCCGCCRPGGGASKSTRRVIGAIFSAISWIAAVIAAVSYLRGAIANTPRELKGTISDGYVQCSYLRGGAFTRAAVFSLVATSFGILSCIFLAAPAAKHAPEQGSGEPKPGGQHQPEAGVAVGLPQWPAQGYGQAPDPKFATPQG